MRKAKRCILIPVIRIAATVGAGLALCYLAGAPAWGGIVGAWVFLLCIGER
jgi:hypothetical protein